MPEFSGTLPTICLKNGSLIAALTSGKTFGPSEIMILLWLPPRPPAVFSFTGERSSAVFYKAFVCGI